LENQVCNGFAVTLFLSKNAEMVVAAKRTVNIKLVSSGTAFELKDGSVDERSVGVGCTAAAGAVKVRIPHNDQR
jgi:hypothetical protein